MMEEGKKVDLTTFGKKMKDQAKGKRKIPIHQSQSIFLVRRRDT